MISTAGKGSHDGLSIHEHTILLQISTEARRRAQPPRGKIGATTRLSTSPNRKCKRTIQQRWHSHARHRSDGSYTHIAGGTDPELERKGQPQHWISAERGDGGDA
jgi:hypothetical protein